MTSSLYDTLINVTETTTKKTPLERKILNRLRRWGRGAVFSNNDFFSLAPDNHVACILHHMKEKGIIRLLMRGLYDYPKYSNLLQEQLAPDLHWAAAALARKYRWHIQPSGNAALNYWGWSTQVPTRLLYLSSGPNRCYTIEGRTLEFRHTSGKETYLGSMPCKLFIQAIKEIGELSLEPEYLPKIQEVITPQLQKDIEKSLPLLTEKIRTLIRTLLAQTHHAQLHQQT